MELRNDNERFTDSSYVNELEDFKKFEETKNRYKTIHGLSDNLASAAAHAELAGNMDLLQKALNIGKASATTTAAPAAEPDPEPEKDDFIIGWENPNDPPHRQKQTRQAQEATTDTDDPFLEGWEKGATGV